MNSYQLSFNYTFKYLQLSIVSKLIQFKYNNPILKTRGRPMIHAAHLFLAISKLELNILYQHFGSDHKAHYWQTKKKNHTVFHHPLSFEREIVLHSNTLQCTLQKDTLCQVWLIWLSGSGEDSKYSMYFHIFSFDSH